MPASTTHFQDIKLRIRGAARAVAQYAKVTRAQNRLRGAARGFMSGLMRMRSALTQSGLAFAALGMAIVGVIRRFAQFSEAEARLSTVLAVTTNEYQQNRQLMQAVGHTAAREMGYGLDEANDAMATMIQTGIGVHRSMRIFRTSLELARIGEMDTARATQFLVDTTNMFREEMVDTGESFQEFAQRMSSQLIVAANMSSTSISDLQQAFRYAGTELSTLGYTSAEVMSALGGLSVVGLRGTTAGTRLRGAVLAMIRPSRQLQQRIDEIVGREGAWREITHDQAGELRRLPDMMSRLMRVMAMTTTVQERQNLEVDLFGRRAFAAGVSMAEFNAAAERMLDTMETLSDRERINELRQRALQARMQNFGMQVQQLRHGINDLAIAFGMTLFEGVGDAERGFGDMVRELAHGVMLLRQMEDGNADARRAFKELSPEMQENSREMQRFFDDLSTTIRGIADLVRAIAWLQLHTEIFTMTGAEMWHRTFLGISEDLRNFGRTVEIVAGSLQRSFNEWARSTDFIYTLQNALDSLLSLFGDLGTAYQEFLLGTETATQREELIQFTNTIQQHVDTLIRWANALTGMAGAYRAVLSAFSRGRRERAEARAPVTAATKEAARAESAETRARRTLYGEEGARGGILAARTEAANQSLRRFAAVTSEAGITSRASIATMLETQGMHSSIVGAYARQISEAQTSMSDAERQRIRESMHLTDAEMQQRQTAETAASQLAALGNAAAVAAQEVISGGSAHTPAGGTAPAGDVLVRRTGFLPFAVSAGDMLVSRAHLAEAMATSRGGMIDALSGITRRAAGPEPTVARHEGVEGESRVPTIVVQVDGREIARAVGRQHVGHLERSGVPVSPDQRRTLRTTGFSERIS